MGHPGEESRETAYVFRRANELVPTGRHIDYLTIETEIPKRDIRKLAIGSTEMIYGATSRRFYDRSRRTKGRGDASGPKREETG
jgi:hypothetical protein